MATTQRKHYARAALLVVLLVSLLAFARGQAQQVSPPRAEFAVMRTDRVFVSTDESTHLNCSVVGTGEAAQMNCESHSSGSGLEYHVALVVGSDKVAYVVSCGGGLVWWLSCHPLAAGQVVKGYIDAGRLRVSVGKKTRIYQIETSAYIGPLGKEAPVASPTTATPPGAEPTDPEPSVKLAVHTKRSDGSSTGPGQADQSNSPVSTAKVMLSSEPTGGDIYVDGNFMGNTPSLIELPAGSHAVRVEAKGQKPWSRTINLTAGSKVTLQAALDAEQ